MGGCASGATPTNDNLDIKQGDLKRNTQNGKQQANNSQKRSL